MVFIVIMCYEFDVDTWEVLNIKKTLSILDDDSLKL